jgi:tRNA splicing ligase
MYGRLAVLEVVQKYVETFTLNTIFLDDDTSASYDLPGVAFTIDLAKTGPRSQNLRVANFDKINFMFSTECFDKLDVLCFRAGLNKNAQMRLTFIEGFGTLPKAPC